MSAFAQYMNNHYDEAILALNRFIELHPGNRDVAYANYVKALCYYEQISDVERDQQMTQPRPRRAGRSRAQIPRLASTRATPGSRSTSRATILPARRCRSAATT